MKFFQYDSPMTTGINKVVDIFWLSILWGVCCLPVVTIGAATTALYYTAVKSLRRNREYVTKTFFHAFRMNLLSSLGLWSVFLAAAFLLHCSLLLTGSIEDDSFRFFASCVYLFMGFLLLGTGCYAFPVLSRCSMRTGENLRFSAGLMVKHFPYTLLLTGILLGSVFVMWYIPLMVFCMPTVGSMGYSLIMEKILMKYTPVAASGVWYMEK